VALLRQPKPTPADRYVSYGEPVVDLVYLGNQML
jgi:hypothetical protein